MASAAVGGGGGGAGAGAAAAAAGPASGSGATDTDLSSEIQTKDVFCLNEDSKFPHKNLFVADDRFELKSDCDPQLLLFVPFTSVVKIRSIHLTAPTDDPLTLPTSVKVFVNKTTLGFDDAESTTPTQEFTLSAEDFASGAAELKLKFHKFQRVTSVHILFDNPDEEEAEVSVLSSIRFVGQSENKTDVSAIKKVEGHDD